MGQAVLARCTQAFLALPAHLGDSCVGVVLKFENSLNFNPLKFWILMSYLRPRGPVGFPGIAGWSTSRRLWDWSPNPFTGIQGTFVVYWGGFPAEARFHARLLKLPPDDQKTCSHCSRFFLLAKDLCSLAVEVPATLLCLLGLSLLHTLQEVCVPKCHSRFSFPSLSFWQQVFWPSSPMCFVYCVVAEVGKVCVK